MDLISVFLIAAGLSMDAFAVSLSTGMALRCTAIDAFKLAFFFGFFQFMMPVIGWAGASSFSSLISSIDHWIAFALLSLIGIKMIYESLKKDENRECPVLNLRTLFILAIATSIDALAVGISFAFLNVSIVKPVIIIGLVTFSFSLAGVYIGKKSGHFFEKKMELFGGLILILIGIKILAEHIFLK
jgi:putative Mn2+ efflux pump MntP